MLNPLEYLDLDERFHDGAAQRRTKVDVPNRAVTKPELHRVVADMASLNDVVVHVIDAQTSGPLTEFATMLPDVMDDSTAAHAPHLVPLH
jgi:hypothetical protein